MIETGASLVCDAATSAPCHRLPCYGHSPNNLFATADRILVHSHKEVHEQCVQRLQKETGHGYRLSQSTGKEGGGVGGGSGGGHSPELPGAGGWNFVSKMRRHPGRVSVLLAWTCSRTWRASIRPFLPPHCQLRGRGVPTGAWNRLRTENSVVLSWGTTA